MNLDPDLAQKLESFCEIYFYQMAGKNKKCNQDALFNGKSVFQYIFKKPEKRVETRPYFIVGVADGVSNSTQPSKASKTVMEALRDLKILNKETIIYLQDTLSESLADHHFGSATTLVAAEINQLERKAKILSVGDSRAYLISKNGEWKQITKDHSILSEIIGENIDLDGDYYASIYSGVSSCLIADNSEFKEKLFYQEISIQSGETILLCTDGLTHGLSDSKRYKLWKESRNVESCLMTFHRAIKTQSFYDDVSILTVNLAK